MNLVMTLTFTFLLLSVASAAPAGVLSADDMLKNAQAAQALNAEFQNLTTSDACSSGDSACISGNLASCSANNTWQTTACPKSLQCFALPSVREANTVDIECTSQRQAASIIQAAGATGGIAVANATSTVDNSSSDGSSNSTTTTDSASPTSGSSDDGAETVTVTVTAASALQTVFTTTISPEEASSILFSLTQNAATTITVSGPLSAITAASVISSALSVQTTLVSASFTTAGVDNEGGAIEGSSPVIKLSAARAVVTATSELPVTSTSVSSSAAGVGY